jgi:hypothetical protein
MSAEADAGDIRRAAQLDRLIAMTTRRMRGRRGVIQASIQIENKPRRALYQMMSGEELALLAALGGPLPRSPAVFQAEAIQRDIRAEGMPEGLAGRVAKREAIVEAARQRRAEAMQTYLGRRGVSDTPGVAKPAAVAHDRGSRAA